MSEENSEENEEPKIVIDDDWKEQVAKEKLTAEESDLPAEKEVDVPELSSLPVMDDEEFSAPPPASFEGLVSMLFTQCMAMLGQIPDPATGKATVNKSYAKHFIDTLEMLGEKTKGNLAKEESKMLSEALHAMRMAYVSTKA